MATARGRRQRLLANQFFRSKLDAEAQAGGSRQGRMEMDVRDAAQWLASQAGCVEVVDVAVRAVEQVEDVDADLHTPREPVSRLHVRETGGLRAHRAVFGERPRTEA